MVVFVDLEQDDDESSYISRDSLRSSRYSGQYSSFDQTSNRTRPAVIEDVHAPPGSIADVPPSGISFSAVLTCYPVALSLSTHLDLNDLHSLSLTCRRIHDSLSQFSHQLVAHSLRCTLDSQPLLSEILAAQKNNVQTAEHAEGAVFGGNTINPAILPPLPSHNPWSDIRLGTGTSAFSACCKINACARDLVAECRKCGMIVCRNCLAKTPSRIYAKDRFRRLCRKCIEAPLVAHLQPLEKCSDFHDSPPISSASSTRSARSTSGASNTSSEPDILDVKDCLGSSFTSRAFLRDPCQCGTHGAYLCGPCGQNLRANDVTYKRVWTWRSRYSTHIGGGLGTGLGVGNQGQKCGRGEHCLETGASGVSWVEIDCSESQGLEFSQDHDVLSLSRTGTPVGEGGSSSSMSNKPGYLQQEIEGIGGVVKKKVKKRVKVGATVWEYEDERESSKYLEREASGKERSWCGWCGRVCLGEKDRQALGET